MTWPHSPTAHSYRALKSHKKLQFDFHQFLVHSLHTGWRTADLMFTCNKLFHAVAHIPTNQRHSLLLLVLVPWHDMALQSGRDSTDVTSNHLIPPCASIARELEVVGVAAGASGSAEEILDSHGKHAEIGLCGRQGARHHFLQIQIDTPHHQQWPTSQAEAIAAIAYLEPVR